MSSCAARRRQDGSRRPVRVAQLRGRFPSRPRAAGHPSASVHHQGRHRRPDGLDAHRRPQAAGRRRGGKPGTGLSGRTARLTLGRLTAALEMAVLEGKLVRNVARLVKPPEHTPRERETWSKAEVKKFLAKAASDRLHAAWRLSLYGLRRGEVPGQHHSTSPEYCRLPVSTRASRSRSSASGPVTMTRLSPSGPTSTRAMTT